MDTEKDSFLEYLFLQALYLSIDTLLNLIRVILQKFDFSLSILIQVVKLLQLAHFISFLKNFLLPKNCFH